MQNIIVHKPYVYIPPHRGNWWPAFIQRFRLIDRWLKKSHGVVGWEIVHAKRLRVSLDAGHGILIAPNHSRPCDPVAIGWLAREVGTHVFAMASWHLFQQDRLTAFAIQKMGGFSVYREGIDRQAINEAIDILAAAERPLIIFPEGGVTRTNDRLHALLEGVGFIARTAAKKRSRQTPSGQVVIHPVAMKYLFASDIEKSLDPILTDIEHRLSWRPQRSLPLVDRITKVGLTLLTLKEIEHMGRPQQASFQDRLQNLINHLLDPLEEEWLGKKQTGGIIARVKALRMKIVPDLVRGELSPNERERRMRQLEDLYLAQQVASYPPDYLTSQLSVDRLLETVERFEEDLTDEVRVAGSLQVVMEVAEAISVPLDRDRSGDSDPLVRAIAESLQTMLDRLAERSRPYDGQPADG